MAYKLNYRQEINFNFYGAIMKYHSQNLIKCLLMLVLFIVISNNKALSSEPLVFVPPLPTDEQLEVFSETEAIYAYQLLELTKMSIVLSTQLQLITNTTEKITDMPTLDQISSLEEEYLKEVWTKARQLYDDVKNNQSKKVDEINKENLIIIEKNYNEIQSLQDSIFWLNMKIADYESMRNQLDSATKYIEILKNDCNELINNNKIAINNTQNLNRTLSFSISGDKYFSNNDNITTEFTPTVALNLYTYSLLGYGKNVDIWIEYTEPVIKTKIGANPEEEFKTRCLSLGLNFQINKVLTAGDLDFSLKIGAGLFWADGRIPNTNAEKSVWNGEKIKFELNTNKLNKNFPFELFAALNLNIPSKSYIVNTNFGNIDYGNKLFTDLALGIRFSLWNN